jgi:hypothetical protein
MNKYLIALHSFKSWPVQISSTRIYIFIASWKFSSGDFIPYPFSLCKTYRDKCGSYRKG